ncbi:MAG: hypothetical protein RIC80_10325 [Cyclobacteriaceae bacterium]
MIHHLLNLTEKLFYSSTQSEDSIDLHIRRIKEHLAQSKAN